MRAKMFHSRLVALFNSQLNGTQYNCVHDSLITSLNCTTWIFVRGCNNLPYDAVNVL